MKKLFFIIFSIFTALLFFPKGSRVFAQVPTRACAKDQECKVLFQECCSGLHQTEVKKEICYYNVQCTVTGEDTLITRTTCELLPKASDQTLCKDCMKIDTHVWTAVGCIDATSTGIINKFLPFGVGIAGGIAFLLILFGALQMMMSAGNPEKLNAGKELVTAAITGLLLIIFSLFLLQMIGFKILRIPGFG